MAEAAMQLIKVAARCDPGRYTGCDPEFERTLAEAVRV
jgi:hypothetical protein